MMTTSDGQSIVAAARWHEEGQYLREFVAKHRLPSIVKIIKGQYAGLGVPSLPSPCTHTIVLLVSAGRRRKILAQAVKIKEGRRQVGVGPKFCIPESYQGYFELLSEDGRAMRCLESVMELAHRKSENGCLVRDSIRAIVGRYDSDGTLSADGARIVNVGEILYPECEVQLGNSKTKFLRCLDSVGDIVLLGMDQKGRFSTLAKEDHISGVHTAKNLLQKRLPVTVRLVHGTPPKGFKNLNQFVPELRLLCAFEEEHLFAIPLPCKDSNTVIHIPLAAPIKLQKARNEGCLRDMREYQRILDKCTKLVADNVNRAYVLDHKSIDVKSLKNAVVVAAAGHLQLSLAGAGAAGKNGAGYFLSRSLSADTNYAYDRGGEIRATGGAHHASRNEYDEIDLIYDYVRGFAPLPKNVARVTFAESDTAAAHADGDDHRNAVAASKPEPPPIETIPKAKIVVATKAEKRTRRPATTTTTTAAAAAAKVVLDEASATSSYVKQLYVKNGCGGGVNSSSQQSRRLLRQKSSSPLKEQQQHVSPIQVPSPASLCKSGSPIFNIRYKSLSNLQQSMELDGTLDSSNSGGKTSADSATGTKLPEKRCRRISRPRSLTNLVWDFHGGGGSAEIEPSSNNRRLYRPAKIEAAVIRRNSTQKSNASSHKRIGTLYL